MFLFMYNKYQEMWLFVFFDLPTGTKKERKASATFRSNLIKNGFLMFQFSVYVRHCLSYSNVQTHIERIQKLLPPVGKVCVAAFTEKQYGDIIVFYGKAHKKSVSEEEQLLFF